MNRPKLLDLFAGEGGAGRGYEHAGFVVYAVEKDPARIALSPHPTHKGDVIDVMARLLRGEAVDFTHHDGAVEWLHLEHFLAVHASPTCTGYSQGTVAIPDRLTRYDRLIGVTRELVITTGLPYVIENVERAKPELRDPVMLCGRMFGLGATDSDGTPLVLDRHRLFESNKHEARHVRHGGYVPASLNVLRQLLGTPWMSEKGCFLSIPPAYTMHVGAQLLAHVRQVAA